jgi:hypothetical protein
MRMRQELTIVPVLMATILGGTDSRVVSSECLTIILKDQKLITGRRFAVLKSMALPLDEVVNST